MRDKADSPATDAWEVKRRIRIPGLARAADSTSLERAVAEVEGILRVSANSGKGWVEVHYLLTKRN